MTARSTVKVTRAKDVVDAMDWKDELRGDREVNCVKNENVPYLLHFIFTHSVGARGSKQVVCALFWDTSLEHFP